MNILSEHFIVIPGISIICYLVGNLIKGNSKITNEKIPLICGAFGGIVSIILFIFTDVHMANDILTACASGIISGWASTGVHQTYKQLTGKE